MKNKHQSPNYASEAGLIFQGSMPFKNGHFIHKTSLLGQASQAGQANQVSQISQVMQASQAQSRHFGSTPFKNRHFTHKTSQLSQAGQAGQASQVSQISQVIQASQVQSRHLGALSYGGLFGVVVSVLTLGMTIATGSVYATDSAIDQIKVSVPIFCSLSSTGTNSHSAEVNSGTYIDDIGTTTIKAICNDNEGFSIYATGFTGNEIGGENSNKLVSGNNTIATGLATGPVGGNDVSNWAMKLSTTTTPTPTYPLTIESDTEGSFTSYHSVPNTYTKVATRSSGTDVGDEAVGSTFTTTYATYISGVQAPGTYVGQVKYTLVHPATEEPLQPQPASPGKIVYHKNDSKAIGTMADQSAGNNTEVTLYPSNFSKQGYGFAGWSDKYNYATNPEANFYGPNEDITTPSDLSTKGLSLYAVWIKSEGSIQDTAKVAEVCNRLTQSGPSITKTLNSVSALTDQRDGNTYAIAKLADGKCWMIENLRLDNTADHNSDGTLAQGYGTSATYGNFGGLAGPESTGFTSTYSANSLYSNDGSNNTINIGTSNYPAYRMPRYNNLNTSARETNTTTSQNIYSYGNYYTWAAAIADTTYYDSNNTSVTNTSLCPTGWHLPTGGLAYANGNTGGVNVTGDTSTFREFYNLGYTIMGSNKTAYEDKPNSGSAYYSSNTTNPDGKTGTAAFRSFPNNFLYSGYFYTSSAYGRGSSGSYWSSTANSFNSSYYLSLYISDVYPGTGNFYKSNGQSIRCVAGS